jgi:transglutaminase-like putative cysteine protease
MAFPRPAPPSPAGGGWRTGLLIFSLAVLAAAAYTLLPMFTASDRGAASRTQVSRSDAATRPHRAPRVSAASRSPWDAPHMARLAATNLAPATGASLPPASVSSSNRLPRGVTGPGRRLAAPAGRAPRTSRELPVFAALRASRNQPIPREVAALAREITRDCRTDAERARAIYDWITGHITYDWKVWQDMVAGADSYTQPQDPLSVIQRGTGVCAGYAWLFDALTASVGIEATYVIGDVRGYRGTTDDALISQFQHAWNSVKLGDQWYLLDATWGARQEGESAAESLARRDYYYQTPANQMIFDHLPETDTWQLLENPVPTDAFQELPNLKPAFFRDGLRLANGFSDSLRTGIAMPTGVTLAAPADVLIAATLSSGSEDITAGNLLVRDSGIRRDVIVGPLPAGEYILRIYAKPATNAGLYECAADYVVTVAP